LGENDQQDLFAKAIDEAEAEFERLTRAQAEARAKVMALRQSLTDVAPIRSDVTPMAQSTPPRKSTGKVRIFGEHFRGRSDVFPRRWENAKSHKSGY
jgi:hypothetical protein